jgi:L-glutamine-phosphate cytidylyltransferase
MRTVVLAAGTGSRLGEITKARTKGMVPVKGKRLIDYLLDFLDIDMMDEVIVVGGFCYEDLRDHIAQRKDPKIRVIENKEYLKGNIFTLVRALREFEDDSFLITNVDHVYPRVMFDMMKKSFTGVRAMCDFDRTLGADDMKVKLSDDKRNVRHMSKQLESFDCGYIGMTYVDRSMNCLYRETVEKVIAKNGDKAVVENILHYLAEEGKNQPSICDLSDFGWYEIDTPEELYAAEKKIVDDPHFAHLFRQ